MTGALVVTVGAALLVIVVIAAWSDKDRSTGRHQHAGPVSPAAADSDAAAAADRYIAELAGEPPAAVAEMPHAVQVWGATPAQMADRIAAEACAVTS